MRYVIICLVTRNTLLPLVVLIFPLVGLSYSPVVLVYPLVVLLCPFFSPLVVLVWPLVVLVCPLAVLVVLSVSLFITDRFVCKSSFNTIDAAIIRSSRPVPHTIGGVLPKRCSYQFRKIYISWSLVLIEVADLQRLTLSKNRLQQRCFIVNFWEISQNTFFYNPFELLLLLNQSYCLLFHDDLLPLPKRCHIYLPAEYFRGLICRLEARMSSTF